MAGGRGFSEGLYAPSFGSGEMGNTSAFLKQRRRSKTLGTPVLRSSALQSPSVSWITSGLASVAPLIFHDLLALCGSRVLLLTP